MKLLLGMLLIVLTVSTQASMSGNRNIVRIAVP